MTKKRAWIGVGGPNGGDDDEAEEEGQGHSRLPRQLEEGLRLEQFYAEPLRQTDDAKEGVAAFVQKRPANFEGK